jgi:hypothetical protein
MMRAAARPGPGRRRGDRFESIVIMLSSHKEVLCSAMSIPPNASRPIEDVGNILLSVQKEMELVRTTLDALPSQSSVRSWKRAR